MKTKGLFCLVLALLITFISFSQEKNDNSSKIKKKTQTTTNNYKKTWSIGAYGGQAIVFGDVNIDPLSFGYVINIQKAMGHTLTFRLQGGMGTAKGVDKKFASTNTIDRNVSLNGMMDNKVNFHPASGYLPVIFNYKMN